MPWEQFESDELDGRLMLIAGYLANKLDNKCVVDLNCGTAPLLKWLPRDAYGVPLYRWYYGNDTNLEFIRMARERCHISTGFWDIPDSEVVQDLGRLRIPPDIILCLGYAARHHELESQTLDEPLIELVKEYKPKIVILEYWAGLYLDAGPQVPELIGSLHEHCYNPVYLWQVSPIVPETDYGVRNIHIFERDDA